MIEFSEDQLIQLAKADIDDFRFQSAINILESLSNTSEVERLKHIANYGLAKLCLANGDYSSSISYLKECTGINIGQSTQSLTNERRRLTNEILGGRVRPVTEYRKRFEKAHFKPTIKLDSGMLSPDVWYVSAVAAYKSRYDNLWRDDLSQLIRKIKHDATTKALRLLGELMAYHIYSQTPILAQGDVLIPVPTSRDRWNKRGYQIPKALAQTVSELCAIPMHADAIEVSGDLPELRDVPRWHRAAVIEGAFKAKKLRWIEDLSLVIIDDVITTGSTVTEIASTLLSAGAKEVAAVSLAYTERTSET